jgi:hypothetical protein
MPTTAVRNGDGIGLLSPYSGQHFVLEYGGAADFGLSGWAWDRDVRQSPMSERQGKSADGAGASEKLWDRPYSTLNTATPSLGRDLEAPDRGFGVRQLHGNEKHSP